MESLRRLLHCFRSSAATEIRAVSASSRTASENTVENKIASEPFPLNRLPQELRELVYFETFPRWIVIKRDTVDDPIEPVITATSRQIRDEALPLFYKYTHFIISVRHDGYFRVLGQDHYDFDAGCAIQWLEGLSARKGKLMRHFKMIIWNNHCEAERSPTDYLDCLRSRSSFKRLMCLLHAKGFTKDSVWFDPRGFPAENASVDGGLSYKEVLNLYLAERLVGDDEDREESQQRADELALVQEDEEDHDL